MFLCCCFEWINIFRYIALDFQMFWEASRPLVRFIQSSAYCLIASRNISLDYWWSQTQLVLLVKRLIENENASHRGRLEGIQICVVSLVLRQRPGVHTEKKLTTRLYPSDFLFLCQHKYYSSVMKADIDKWLTLGLLSWCDNVPLIVTTRKHSGAHILVKLVHPYSSSTLALFLSEGTMLAWFLYTTQRRRCISFVSVSPSWKKSDVIVR